MTRAASMRALALLALALLHTSSAARFLLQDPAEPAADLVEPAADVVATQLEPEVQEVDGASLGVVLGEGSCDLSVDDFTSPSCSLEDDGTEPMQLPVVDGTDASVLAAFTTFSNLPDDLAAVTFEGIDVDIVFDDEAADPKVLYAAVVAGKNPQAMLECAAAIFKESSTCTVPSDDVFFMANMLGAEGTVAVAEDSGMGTVANVGAAVASIVGTATVADDVEVNLANTDQIAAVKASDVGEMYVGCVIVTNQALTINKLGLTGVAQV